MAVSRKNQISRLIGAYLTPSDHLPPRAGGFGKGKGDAGQDAAYGGAYTPTASRSASSDGNPAARIRRWAFATG